VIFNSSLSRGMIVEPGVVVHQTEGEAVALHIQVLPGEIVPAGGQKKDQAGRLLQRTLRLLFCVK